MRFCPTCMPLCRRPNLTRSEAEAAMRMILAGESTPAQIAAFLMALRMKGETVDELVGFARAMRQMAAPVDRGPERRAAARYLRHGRRRRFDVQHFHHGGVRGGGRRRARGQAWQPVDIEPVRQRRYAGSSGVRMRDRRRRWRRARFAKWASASCLRPRFHGATRHVQPVRIELKMRTRVQLSGTADQPRRCGNAGRGDVV